MRLKLIIIPLIAVLFSSCELDSNLFNPETVSEYKLPGNTIADSLIEQISFSSEGNTLYGFWVSSAWENPVMTVLYCHGNKHNLDEYWDRVMMLHEVGVNVFIFDYRGFGKSEGESSESGMYADGRAALDFIKKAKDVEEDSLCIYGYSLGNVSAIYLAAEVAKPKFLISEAPFASANSLLQGSVVLDIPQGWLTEGNFNNVEMVKRINSKFILIHGTDDEFVRYNDNGRLVFEAAPEPKELKLIEGGHHNDVPYKMGVDNYIRFLGSIFYGWETSNM